MMLEQVMWSERLTARLMWRDLGDLIAISDSVIRGHKGGARPL